MTVYIPEHKFIFYHIPKAGGKSIEKWFKKNIKCEILMPEVPHLIPKQVLKIVPDLDHSLCVVRNPWDRMVSFYKFYMELNSHGKAPKIMWKNHYKYDISNITFLNFLDLCEKNDDFLLLNNTQLKYLDDKAHKNNIILKFENLNFDFKIIQKFFNCYDPLLHFHKSSDRTPYQKYYNSQAVDIVYKKYKNDIEYFKYSFE
jgi:hypothetical protein